ncbi:hypothetical protein PENSPDRAFT_721312 [Peniophora sp. CONT]|nr:hypothetical protein PENSPDRAFT_721312 [Peniophora sp. CONT]
MSPIYTNEPTASVKVTGYSVSSDDDSYHTASEQRNTSPLSHYSLLSAPSIDRNTTIDSISGDSSRNGWTLVHPKDERRAQRDEDNEEWAALVEQLKANRKAASDRIKEKNLERKAADKEKEMLEQKQQALRRLLSHMGLAPPDAASDHARLAIQMSIDDDGSVGDAYIAPNTSQEDVSLPAASDVTQDEDEDLQLLYPSPPPSPPVAHAPMDIDGALQHCMNLIKVLTLLNNSADTQSNVQHNAPQVVPPQVVPPRNRTIPLPPTEQYNDLSRLPTFNSDPIARLRLRRIMHQTMPRGVRQAKANVVNNKPYARIPPRDRRPDNGPHSPPDYAISRKPDWAHTPQEAAEYAPYLDRHLLAKLYLGEPNFGIDGRYLGTTREGQLASYLTNTLVDWAIRTRLPLALAMAHNMEYRGRCSRNALPLPTYQRLMYTEKDNIEKIHRDMHRCGVSPDEVDYAMGPTVTILDWAVRTKSGVVTAKMRQQCRYALDVAQERLSRLDPMPHSYVPYRAALLERILAKHREEVKHRISFSATEFPDVVKEYTQEVHERRFGLL